MKKILILFLCILKVSLAFNQPVPQSYYQDLKYRMIGPFRAGRTVGAVGIPDKPNVFFIGVNNGGVWKTDDYGRTWSPIFDTESTGSIGDLAVSLSNNNIIYVGTGEGLHRPDLSIGEGMFKSNDGGKSWKHIGLKDVQQISRVIIHPKNPDIVFVAGMGHPYGPNEERGIFKSIDGGITWQKVLYINQNTCAMQVEMDPVNPNILYADMWEHREGPWENAGWSGKNSGLHKSIDGGKSWKPLTKGLPGASEGLGRIGFCIAYSNPKIIYATVDAAKNGGIYMSKDAGESWTMMSGESRLWGRGSDFAEIKIHPKNPNKLYVANTASYSSDDGGKTWTGLKGAPGGDDYHRIWINPINPDIMLFAADQGATITVNAGRTWSSWYNQPTAQLYHVSTDNQFPYYVYGGQQESGALGIASRGEGGQITFRDWKGVGSDEYAYVAADPLNPDIIYGGKLIRYDRRTGLGQNIAPEALRSGNYRMLRTMPLLFHPADLKSLLFATNVLWRTRNGGQSWDIISPDLTRSKYDIPESIGDFRTEEMKN
ncbi:MAG: glycoside hydrolase, partial [Saprospiraceae bacterium]|nr:glycoside hydrolase [Saprospiraceae bacterium]